MILVAAHWDTPNPCLRENEMPCRDNARQHANACSCLKEHCKRRGYICEAIIWAEGGKADRIIKGHGPVILFLEIKTGGARLQGNQEDQMAIANRRGILQRKAQMVKLPGNRWDYSQVDAAIAEMDRLNLILANALNSQ